MDILLVNSPLFDEPGIQHEDSLPPLGLGYLATAAMNAGFEVELLDAVADDCGTTGVIQAIRLSRPKFVGLNIFSTNLDLVHKIVIASFDAHIIIGGPAVRTLADIVLGWESPNPITVIEGEAEHALPAFMKGHIAAQPWRGRADRGIIRITQDHYLFPHNIDLPLHRKFFRHEPILDAAWDVREAHITTSRGCGHDCAFCAAARAVNQFPIRSRSPHDVREEIEQLKKLMPDMNGIRIIDDLFIRNRKAIERACGLFRDTELSWRAMAHVNGFRGVDSSLYDEMKRSGCMELFVGVESGNPVRRKAIGKPADIEPTLGMVANLLRSGIAVKAYFIMGFPEETRQEMEDTLTVAKMMKDVAAQSEARFRASVFKFRPYHGARLYNELVASGAKIGRITGDSQLSADSGRHQFSFKGENYSCVDDNTLNDFICATQEIGA